MNTNNTDAAVVTFQVAKGDLGPLVIDRLGIACTPRSPLASALDGYTAGTGSASDALAPVATSPDAAKAVAILARPGLVMSHRTGGGALPVSFYSACHQADADLDAWAVVSPSYRGAFLVQLFEDRYAFLAWWLTIHGSQADETVPNYIAPPTTLEETVYLLHAIDTFRRCAYQNQLDFAPSETPLIGVDAFTATLRDSVRSGDLRWLLPTFLALTPGLDLSAFDESAIHLQALVRRDFLIPAAIAGGPDDRLLFGEAGRVLGVEFFRSWFQAVGFETVTHTRSGWRVANRGLLAPTGIANHLFRVERDPAGRVRINHQALTRQDLDGELVRMIGHALDGAAGAGGDDLPLAAPSATDDSERPPTVDSRPLKTVADALTCATCGAALQPEQSFCTQCGAPSKPTCPDCGAIFEKCPRFCTACGAKLQADSERS